MLLLLISLRREFRQWIRRECGALVVISIMSTQNRKIAFYAITFDDDCSFSKEYMLDYLVYLSQISLETRLVNNIQTNMAMALSDIILNNDKNIARLVIKSCKYNHSPDYMSSVDGSVRPTAKLLHEGEEEKTHFIVKFEDREAVCVLEERRTGVTIKSIVEYFNKYIDGFTQSAELEIRHKFNYAVILNDDFLTALNTAQRISSAEISFQKKILGSDCLNIATSDDCDEIRDELELSIKSKPREGIAKRLIHNLFNIMTTDDEKISRIRLHGKDINDVATIIDSKGGCKTTAIKVDLAPNGVVSSASIFEKMEELICEDVP